jgi:hypothetical protein
MRREMEDQTVKHRKWCPTLNHRRDTSDRRQGRELNENNDIEWLTRHSCTQLYMAANRHPLDIHVKMPFGSQTSGAVTGVVQGSSETVIG